MSLAAGPALASSTLYGQLNLGVEVIDARSPGAHEPTVQRLSSNSSRIGLRGVETLGRGLSAIWQIESSIAGDAGGGAIAGRETFIGLDGSFGTLKVGNFLSPYDDIHPIFGNVPTLTTSILSTAAIWSQGSLSKVAGGFDARLANSIRYDAPEFRGLEVGIQLSLGENPTGSYVLSAGGTYINGPFEGGLAYERNHDVRSDGIDDWAFTAAAAWNFGNVRVAGVYERLRYQTPVGPLTRNFVGASATILAGPGSVYLFWGRAQDGRAPSDVRVGGLTTGRGSGADQIEVSYTYPLSPRTFAYLGAVRLANESRASYNFATNPYTAGSSTGLKLNGFVAGAVHFF